MEVNFDKQKNDPKAASDDDEQQQTGQVCKDCGIKVPMGYVKCPKCHARLPGAPVVRTATGTTTLAGARRPTWFLLLLAIAGSGAIYYHFLADSSSNVSGPRASANSTAATHRADGDGGVPAVADDDADAGPPATAEDREAALTELVDALGAVEIDATAVELAGDDGVIVLRSEGCEAKELADIIGEAEEMLAQADFHTVRCFSPGGLLTFKRSW